MTFSPSHAFGGLTKNIDLRITWDSEKTTAVFAPVADFFGYAFGSVSMKSLLVGADNESVYCYIPMPFDRSAKVELIYRKSGSGQPVLKIKSRVTWTHEKRDEKAEGKFYAYWKRESPAIGRPYVFLEGTGRGHYVGTLLLGQAKSYTHHTEFFEGDDSTVLDDHNLLHGTGSEDYFNGGWYAQPNGWVERKGAPLHGCLDYSLPLSRTGGYRFYLTDKLPFQKSIYHSIEHGPVGNNRLVDYTSIAMYYADQPLAIGKPPSNETSRIFIPDTLSFYPRLMEHVKYEGEAKLSDGNAVIEADRQGIFIINMNDVPPGQYELHGIGTGMNGMQHTLPGASKPVTLKMAASAGNEVPRQVLGKVIVGSSHDPVRITTKAGKERLAIHIFQLSKKK
jgi:hypothetical protein